MLKKLNVYSGQVRVDTVLDDVFGQCTFPTGDIDLERPPGAGPAEYGDVYRVIHALIL